MKRRPARSLEVSAQAADAIIGAAAARSPLETGGILTGWYQDGLIVIDNALEVPDDNATHVGYERDHARATEVLQVALRNEPPGSPIGYVGEWHTHPAPQGPSTQDFAAMQRIARRSSTPVGLIVAMRESADTWKLLAMVLGRWRRHRATVTPADSAT